MLRSDGPLTNLASMRNYCYQHGGKITEDGRCFGYIAETEHYRYCLRCTPSPGEYQGYLYSYDLRQQRMAQQAKPVGRITYASGEEQTFTDAQKYLDTIREELPYQATKALAKAKTITRTARISAATIAKRIHILFPRVKMGPALVFLTFLYLGLVEKGQHPQSSGLLSTGPFYSLRSHRLAGETMRKQKV